MEIEIESKQSTCLSVVTESSVTTATQLSIFQTNYRCLNSNIIITATITAKYIVTPNQIASSVRLSASSYNTVCTSTRQKIKRNNDHIYQILSITATDGEQVAACKAK